MWDIRKGYWLTVAGLVLLGRGILFDAAAAPLSFGISTQDLANAKSAVTVLDDWCKSAARSPGRFYVFYMATSDRDHYPAYEERLDRVLKDIQSFYRTEMETNGLGPLTFPLELDGKGKLVVHYVKSHKPQSAYNRQSHQAILDEITPAIQQAGIDRGHSTILIVTTLPEGAPFCGSGTYRNGICWTIDLPYLDAARFADGTKIPSRWKTVGGDNSVYIGGIAHELGHAFGLPHNNDRPNKSRRGTSLMGSGNYTYRDDLRGGQGTFLAAADALRLASHPLFRGIDCKVAPNAFCQFDNPGAVRDGDAVVISGVMKASPPVYAVLAYNDPDGGNDYDARVFTSVPDNQGHFSIRLNEFHRSKQYRLRLTACLANGDVANMSAHYKVSAAGVPEIAPVNEKWKQAAARAK